MLQFVSGNLSLVSVGLASWLNLAGPPEEHLFFWSLLDRPRA